MRRTPLLTIAFLRFTGGFLGAVFTLATVAFLTNNGAGLL